MPEPRITVAIPTLKAEGSLLDCVRSIERQTALDVEIVVVDNSGQGLAQRTLAGASVRILANRQNVGFGAAVNQVWRAAASPYIATLNDDAAADRVWLDALVRAMEQDPRTGMCASQVRLVQDGRLDSAGMLVCGDGSSKQRGHRRPVEEFAEAREVLLPSGSAALFRRAMLEDIGGFDDEFFLYCEDTDLGLRARWRGWNCRYVPEAIVEHHYSQTAGSASPLKAYYVERNRIAVLVKNFPMRMAWKAPFLSLARYGWHVATLATGRGPAARYKEQGNGGFSLAGHVVRAHFDAASRLPGWLAQRRAIRRSARIAAEEFCGLLRRHSIGVREVAEA